MLKSVETVSPTATGFMCCAFSATTLLTLVPSMNFGCGLWNKGGERGV